jgi:hypothetical protein
LLVPDDVVTLKTVTSVPVREAFLYNIYFG